MAALAALTRRKRGGFSSELLTTLQEVLLFRRLRFLVVPACLLLTSLQTACVPNTCREADPTCNDWALALLFPRQTVAREIYLTDNIANTVSAYSVDHRTGLLTLLGQAATQTLPRGVVHHPAGFLYVANETTGSIFILS